MTLKTSYEFNLGLAFYQIADQYAKRVALSYPDDTQLTYQELNELSNRIARLLQTKKVQSGDVVAIFNDKSPVAFAIMLACLKTGAIYTNLDGTNPWERLRKIVATCLPKLIFYDIESESIRKEVASSFKDILEIQFQTKEFQDEVNKFNPSNLQELQLIHGGAPAYIMFTSGSTGFPKGAVMSHNNVLNFIQWGRQTFRVTPDDIFTNVNPVYFDNSVFDFYTSLFSGATLVPLNATITKNTKALVQAINRSKCTIWFSVPSLLVYLLTTKALTGADFSMVKRIAFGGEGFPKNKMKQLFDLLGDRIELFNVYGPTECTCICSSYRISSSDFDNMLELAPLGNIAPNFGYEIIATEEEDPSLGELALIGPCVGLGYYNDPERTAASFIQNKKRTYHERMYKTGDLVERGSNGYLYFKGRVDNQIKHMGYRIELEEVEAAFSSLEYINEVGVIYEKITPDLGQIKAFISLADKTKLTEDIQQDIKHILPSYMVPKIKVMEILPKNRNGKIDRKQLASMV